jgi:GTP-binding protein EngB required for normal cell division
MRANGASATDILIVVIAAESGVQPQTAEVLDLARNSNLSVVIAVTKMDKLHRSAEKEKVYENDEKEEKDSLCFTNVIFDFRHIFLILNTHTCAGIRNYSEPANGARLGDRKLWRRCPSSVCQWSDRGRSS